MDKEVAKQLVDGFASAKWSSVDLLNDYVTCELESSPEKFNGAALFEHIRGMELAGLNPTAADVVRLRKPLVAHLTDEGFDRVRFGYELAALHAAIRRYRISIDVLVKVGMGACFRTRRQRVHQACTTLVAAMKDDDAQHAES